MRYLLVPSIGTISKAQAEVPKGPRDQTERVPAGIPADMQADAPVHYRRLRGWT